VDRPQPRPAHHAAVNAAQRGGTTSVDHVAGLLATALERNPKLGLFLRLAVVLGARRGELCALRWQHVDLDRGEVLLERGEQVARELGIVGPSIQSSRTKTPLPSCPMTSPSILSWLIAALTTVFDTL
jgi:integrase